MDFSLLRDDGRYKEKEEKNMTKHKERNGRMLRRRGVNLFWFLSIIVLLWISATATTVIIQEDGEDDYDTTFIDDYDLNENAMPSTAAPDADGVPQHQPSTSSGHPPPFFVICSVDGSIHVVDALKGSIAAVFTSGTSLVGPSELLQNQHRIVPGLDGHLYISRHDSQREDDIDNNDGGDFSFGYLEPLGITVMDVLQNPVKTCKQQQQQQQQQPNSSEPSTTTATTDPNVEHHRDDSQNQQQKQQGASSGSGCGIVTATKTTSLYALDSLTGELVWQQYANGTIDVASSTSTSSTRSTILLQREDILVQQLSTDSGQTVWNVTLGTFQALDFGDQQRGGGGGSSSLVDEDHYITDGSSSGSNDNNGRNILLDAYETTSNNYKTPKQQPPSLPHVLFGPDGTTLTAVHPSENYPMWNIQFPTVMASVFGLCDKSWKPLTVLDDDDGDEELSNDEIHGGMDVTVFHHHGGSGDLENRPGILGKFGVKKSYNMDYRWNFRNTLWQRIMYWFSGRNEESPYVSVISAAARGHQQHRRPGQLTNSIQQQWKVTSTSAESFLTTTTMMHEPSPKLALPSPETVLHPHHGGSGGLFLTWPVVIAIVLSFFLGAAFGFRYIYTRKKKRWLGLLRAAVADKTFHFGSSSNGDNDKNKTEANSTTASMTESNTSTSNSMMLSAPLRRSHSLPGLLDFPDHGGNKNNNTTKNEPLSSPPTHSSNLHHTLTRRISTPAFHEYHPRRHQRANTIDGGYTVKDTNKDEKAKNDEDGRDEEAEADRYIAPPPPQQHNVGFLMDGVPLIRYSRYESEFQEVVALGKGGFGTVFRCKNVLDGREYAIKKVRIDTSADSKHFSHRLQRTLREVKSLALLDHPNIVRYYTAWLEVVDQQQLKQQQQASSGAATSDYYLMSTTTVGTKTLQGKQHHQQQHSFSYFGANSPQYSTNDLLSGGGWDSKSPKNNPLGTYWDREDESLSHRRGCGGNDNDFMPFGIPPALDDYGFTFDRSGEDEDNDTKKNEDTSNSGYHNDYNSNNVGCGSSVSADHSIHTGGSESYNSISQSNNRFSLQSSRQEENGEGTSSALSPDPAKKKATVSGKTETKTKNTASTEKSPKHVKHILYIQMQFCSQNTLADFLGNKDARRGPRNANGNNVDIPFALHLFLQIVQGVKHVHSQGLIHRDLKPNNCFMDDAGIIKVGDFGLSRESSDTKTETEGGEKEQAESSAPATLLGGDITAGVGTRSYASPEQMKGSDYDSSTDVYSLGIMLFELCYPMYTGMERNIVLSKLRNYIFPDLWKSTVQPAFPSLHTLLMSMLSNTPAERPTAETVGRSIQSILEGFTISSLDKHQQQQGSILLRVEAKPREDVLQHTMQLIKEAAALQHGRVDIVQYGLRGGTSDKATMEFALDVVLLDSDKDDEPPSSINKCTQSAEDAAMCFGNGIVARMSLMEDVLLIRQVSATKYA